jgi:hypothetical protein
MRISFFHDEKMGKSGWIMKKAYQPDEHPANSSESKKAGIRLRRKPLAGAGASGLAGAAEGDFGGRQPTRPAWFAG